VSTDTLSSSYVDTLLADITSSYNYNGYDVSCFGYNDGGAEVIASGGHAPYTYQWFGGSSATTSTINNLYSGLYSVTIRDTNNCMINRSIVLAEPSVLTFNTSGNIDESCLGACDGIVFIDSLAGGVSPYTALLTDNITASVSSHVISNDSILGVCSGNYTVVLTDINDCPSSVISGGVNQQLIGYDTITVAEITSLTGAICYSSSSGELNVLNPISSYSYSWENINNPGVIISTAAQANNLVAGIYVLLADYNSTFGCTATDTIEILEFSEIMNGVTITSVDCYGQSTGSILASASGTVPSYSYTWSSGQTNALANNLSAGTYMLVVEDGNDCESEFTYIVTEPQALTVNITESSYVLTAGNPVGGTPPYLYSWREQSAPNTSIGTGMTYTITNYGIYYVLITDANGCTVTSNVFDNLATGIDQLSSALSIYPNPFKEETTVDFGRDIKQASIKVVDVFGKIIEEHSITNVDKHILRRNNKASGIYFVEIEVDQKEKTIYKLIVE